VPDSSGRAIVCAEVVLEVRVTGVVLSPYIWRFPLLVTVNLVAPDLEAVKRSPVPELSIMKAELSLMVPEKEAMGVVADVPRTSNLARGLLVPTPTLPESLRLHLLLNLVY